MTAWWFIEKINASHRVYCFGNVISEVWVSRHTFCLWCQKTAHLAITISFHFCLPTYPVHQESDLLWLLNEDTEICLERKKKNSFSRLCNSLWSHCIQLCFLFLLTPSEGRRPNDSGEEQATWHGSYHILSLIGSLGEREKANFRWKLGHFNWWIKRYFT